LSKNKNPIEIRLQEPDMKKRLLILIISVSVFALSVCSCNNPSDPGENDNGPDWLEEGKEGHCCSYTVSE